MVGGYVIVGVLSVLVAFVVLYKAPISPLSAGNYGNDKAWYGRADGAVDVSVRPFKVAVEDAVLTDLKARLASTRSFAAIETTGWSYGANSEVVHELAAYWASDAFDWRAIEAKLNAYPQFLTQIDGLDMHFVHVKADRTTYKTVHPALLVHGWPGSFFEFYKVIDGLVAPQQGDVAFDVVVPSLPGFGFSERPSVEGVSAVETAVILHKLMERLGYNNFYYQGGDWGGIIGTILGQIYPDIYGVHLNMFITTGSPFLLPVRVLLGQIAPSFVLPNKKEADIFLPLFPTKAANIVRTLGYMYVQGTFPDTAAFGLTDSPIGLLAWITEKFYLWSDNKGDIYNSFSKEEIVTSVMIYWATNTISSSMRLYRESLQNPVFLKALAVDGVAAVTGLLVTPNGYPYENAPLSWAAYKYHNIVSYNITSSGGHFAAMEKPEALVKDFFHFVSAAEQFHAQKRFADENVNPLARQAGVKSMMGQQQALGAHGDIQNRQTKRQVLGEVNRSTVMEPPHKSMKINNKDTASAALVSQQLAAAVIAPTVAATTATGRVKIAKAAASTIVAVKAEPITIDVSTEPKAPATASYHLVVSRVQLLNNKHNAETIRLGIENIDTKAGLTPEDEPEYAHSSFEYMRGIEIKYMPTHNYMDTQADLSWRMRSTLVDWLVGVHWRFSMASETLFLCVNIIDRFLAIQIIPRHQLQLVGIVALLVAAKYEEIYSPPIVDLRYLCEDSYSTQEILQMEQQIFAKLKFNLGMPSPIVFLRRVSKAEDEQFATRIIGKYLIETSILSERFIKYTPSLIAAASMLAARRIRAAGEWDTKMQYYSGYSEQELEPCVNDFVAFLNSNERYRAIYRKYNSSQFYRASQYVEQHLRSHNNGI